MNANERARSVPELVDLNELIVGVVKLLTRLVGEDIAISTDLAPGLDPVNGNRELLEQMVMHVAVNARDAMPQGGLLTIRTGKAFVSAGDPRYPDLPGGHYVSLVVVDTGCGMTDDVKARIFEPFFTTKGVGKGTGLGLAMVHGIVRTHGGVVTVESAVGVGTTVEFLLPADAADTPLVVLRDAPRGNETVLVVNTDGAARDLYRAVLRLFGYTVLTAGSGAEAVRLAGSWGTIHLLLTGRLLGDLSARELATALRTERPNIRTLCADGDMGDCVAGYGLGEGIDAILLMPSTPRLIAFKVREVLDTPQTG